MLILVYLRIRKGISIKDSFIIMKTKRLLLVEDNPDDELLTCRALKKYSEFNCVDVANDGIEALEYLSIHTELPSSGINKSPPDVLPDLILLDLKMPRLNGHEFLKYVRGNARTAHIPIIILTTSNEEKDITVSYELGANSFLRKPVNFLDFAKVIEQVSHYWLDLNVPSPQLAANQ